MGGLIVLFSGQGGLRREHAARLASIAKPDIAMALDAALGLDPATLTDSQLAENRHAQPIICALQLSLWRQLAPLLPRPSLFAGYSLGEVMACCAAGAFPDEAAVSLAAARARFMDEATDEPCGMLAVLGMSEARLRPFCATLGVEIAIRNGPTHFVVGGAREALAALETRAVKAGATRTQALPVTTPSHTPRLHEAGARFGEALPARLQPGALEVPVLGGIDAHIIRTGAAALAALARQIHTRLDWAACMDSIVEMQPDAVLEIGPGAALAKMLIELEPRLEARSVDDFRSAEAAAHWVASRV